MLPGNSAISTFILDRFLKRRATDVFAREIINKAASYFDELLYKVVLRT